MDALIADLAFLSTFLSPFSTGTNWGVLYILVAQARRLLMDPSSSIDRMSNGLDLLMMFLAANREEARKVYTYWSTGRFDEDFYEYGDDMRRYAMRYTGYSSQLAVSKDVIRAQRFVRWPHHTGGFWYTKKNIAPTQEELTTQVPQMMQDIGAEAACVLNYPVDNASTKLEIRTFIGFGLTRDNACDAAQEEALHHASKIRLTSWQPPRVEPIFVSAP